MSERLAVTKTYKLCIGGAFPRTESGRSTPVHDAQRGLVAHVCRASRKDLRDAVEAAAAARGKWSGSTAYLRGQVLYRLAEMLEARRDEFAEALAHPDARTELDACVDRTVAFAGWADKFAQVWGGANPVAGPYHNFSVPGPVGVTGIVCPDQPALLGLLTLTLPAIVLGGTAVVLASETNPIPAAVLGEALATSDLPGGVVNILTGFRDELVPHFATHRGLDALHAAGLSPEHRAALRAGSAENLKRVTVRETADRQWYDEACQSPWWIEPFAEVRTVWHPSAT